MSMAESYSPTPEKDLSKADTEGEEYDSPSPKPQRRVIRKKKPIKKKKAGERKFDWPKKNYYELTCEDPVTNKIQVWNINNVYQSLRMYS